MCPQHRIKHKAAISNSKYCVHTVVAAVCFIPFCGHINKHSRKMAMLYIMLVFNYYNTKVKHPSLMPAFGASVLHAHCLVHKHKTVLDNAE